MFIELWMVAVIIIAFGACAYYSYKNGQSNGVLAGITGTFEYLEKNRIIKFNANGSIEGLKNKISYEDALLKK